MTKLLAQQGLESIAYETNNPAYQQHAQKLYDMLTTQKYPAGQIVFEKNSHAQKEIQQLFDRYDQFMNINDPDSIINQRHQALQEIINNPTATTLIIIPNQIIGFLSAHGLDQQMIFDYEQTTVQGQISHEVIQIITQLLQINHHNPCPTIGRCLKSLHRAIAQVSQQTLLSNRLEKYLDAFESADLGWMLISYGPDMIAGACDAIIAPIHLAAQIGTAVTVVGYQTVTHPIDSLQKACNGLVLITGATRKIGQTLYDNVQNGTNYVVTHDPKQWYDDARRLCKRSIDIVSDVASQAHDYITTTDPHQAIRCATSLSVGYFILPLAQARAATAVNTFAQTVRSPLLTKVYATQTSIASIIARTIQQTKRISNQSRQKLAQLTKQIEEIIHDLAPQPSLAVQTTCGELITNTSPSVIQATKDQLFLFAQNMKEKAKSIVPILTFDNFAKYNRHDIILPEVIASKGIKQIEYWREITKNFTDLGTLQDYHKLYLNYAYYMHHTLEPFRKQVQSLGLSFYHEGQLYKIKDIDLVHVFLGDMRSGKYKLGGIHHVSEVTKNMYFMKLKNIHNKIQNVELFRKNKGIRVGSNKTSTMFIEEWDIPTCIKVSIEILKKQKLQTRQKGKAISILGDTTCGTVIEFIYNPIIETIESFYPFIHI